jgi:hypothetical protein
MDILFILLTILGLSVFEIITSIDNAVINAEVLSTMSQRARRWFLLWGFLFAVIVVRGILPLLLVFATNPSLGITGAFMATITGGDQVAKTIEESSKPLLLGGGVFLVFLFLDWLFLEPKNYGLRAEKFFHSQGAWFFALVSIILAVIVFFALKLSDIMAFGAVLGSTAFFIVHGFREYAQTKEQKLISDSKISDISKIAYLEVLDTTFSIDGIVGAFAFTFSVPLILLGNGLGAFILRKLTVSNIERIKKYKYLKNGAMYSVLFLGIIMVLDGFGAHIPKWFSPVITFGTVFYFFNKSRMSIKDVEEVLSEKKTK